MIYLLNEEKYVDDNTFNVLEKLFNQALKYTKQKSKKLCVSLQFVSLEEIHELNKSARGVDRATDILSFPLTEVKAGEVINIKDYPFDVDRETGELSIGDLVVCLDKIKEQAKEYGHSEMRELCYLFTHGVLHLLGYDHEQEKDKAIMRKAEEEILEKVDSSLKR